MAFSSHFSALNAVARQLPFHINDVEQANAAFERWRTHGGMENKRLVDLWTYCYVRRYFLAKFLGFPVQRISDLDVLLEKAFRKTQEQAHTVADETRYTSWVGVICKNVFLNYLREERIYVSVDQVSASELPSLSPDGHLDSVLDLETVVETIESLPDYLREIAHLRFRKHQSYQEIAEQTGRSLPVVRSYVNKIVTRFRADPHFQDLLKQIPGKKI